MKTILKNGTIFNKDFDKVKASIAFEDGKIIKIVDQCCNSCEGKVIDVEGLIVMPGMIDIHIHGCGGSDSCDATPEALETISRTLVKNGITSFCPTSMTLSYETLAKTFANVADMKEKVSGSYIQGVNMEGPYISMAKKGAQNANFVRNPDKDEFKRLFDGCGGNIKLVDIAPECDGAEEFVKAVSPYCTISIAHTSANYDQAVKGIEWGIRHVTHLYNAQSGLTHRSPGVVGAVFDNARTKGVRAELICDGFHIHPAALRIAFFMLGEDNSIIISDSMKATGCPDGDYDLGGQTVYVREGKALLADGTIAASTSNLHQELKNVIRFGIPEKQAVKSVTINPAKAIRVDKETGSLEEGKSADILVLDKDYNIKLVIVKGEIKINNL